MKKWTIYVIDRLLDLNDMILIQIHSIHKTKLSITLKYHLFEVVTFKILDLKGHRYEIKDYLC